LRDITGQRSEYNNAKRGDAHPFPRIRALRIRRRILLRVLSFLLFTDISVFRNGYSKTKLYVADSVGPVLKAISAPIRSADYVLDSYINLVSVKRKNQELKKRIEAMEVENQKILELEKENERLKALLGLKETEPKTFLAAHIIGEDVMNWFKCVVIDKGQTSGIRVKMPVITEAGLVGQTVEVNRWHTKVMIINDTNSAVDTYVAGKHTRGIAEGTGKRTLKLKYVLKNDDVSVGDRLITSGKDAIYPKDLAVGIVTSVDKSAPGLFSEIDVMPFNNFRKLEEVLVVKKP
jgi:rod shape-determining protein MreC